MLTFPTFASADEANASEPVKTSTNKPLAEKLIGSWRIIDAHRDGVPSEVHDGVVTIKHITPTQYVWLSYRPDQREMFRSMGGSWTIEDGQYVETALYGMRQDFIHQRYGRVTRIDVDVDDEQLTQTITSETGSNFVEVWRRIEISEDPIAAEVNRN